MLQRTRTVVITRVRGDGSHSIEEFEVRRIRAGDLAQEGIGAAYGRALDAIAGGGLIEGAQKHGALGAAFAAAGEMVALLTRLARHTNFIPGEVPGAKPILVADLDVEELAPLIEAFVALHTPEEPAAGKADGLAPLMTAVMGPISRRIESALASGSGASSTSSTNSSAPGTPSPTPSGSTS